MKLDRSHLNQFENIAPPMKHALTLPVEGAGGTVSVYVCSSTFSLTPATKPDVLAVAKALRLLDEETITELRAASDYLMTVPGGHQNIVDLLNWLVRGDS